MFNLSQGVAYGNRGAWWPGGLSAGHWGRSLVVTTDHWPLTSDEALEKTRYRSSLKSTLLSRTTVLPRALTGRRTRKIVIWFPRKTRPSSSSSLFAEHKRGRDADATKPEAETVSAVTSWEMRTCLQDNCQLCARLASCNDRMIFINMSVIYRPTSPRHVCEVLRLACLCLVCLHISPTAQQSLRWAIVWQQYT